MSPVAITSAAPVDAPTKPLYHETLGNGSFAVKAGLAQMLKGGVISKFLILCHSLHIVSASSYFILIDSNFKTFFSGRRQC